MYRTKMIDKTPLSEEEKAECSARIKEVQDFMYSKEVDIIAYPQFAHNGDGTFHSVAVCQFVDTKYAPKPNGETNTENGIPSPFLKS